jgi:hypothetical protein
MILARCRIRRGDAGPSNVTSHGPSCAPRRVRAGHGGCLLAAACGAHRSSSTSPAGPGLIDTHRCSGQPGFSCSTLSVPLDPTAATSPTLRLQVAAADNVSAPRGVLLFLTGGRGTWRSVHQPDRHAEVAVAGAPVPVCDDRSTWHRRSRRDRLPSVTSSGRQLGYRGATTGCGGRVFDDAWPGQRALRHGRDRRRP